MDRPSRSEMLWFLRSIIEIYQDLNPDQDLNNGMLDTARREFHYLKRDWLMERKLNAEWRKNN